MASKSKYDEDKYYSIDTKLDDISQGHCATKLESMDYYIYYIANSTVCKAVMNDSDEPVVDSEGYPIGICQDDRRRLRGDVKAGNDEMEDREPIHWWNAVASLFH